MINNNRDKCPRDIVIKFKNMFSECVLNIYCITDMRTNELHLINAFSRPVYNGKGQFINTYVYDRCFIIV